MTCYAQQGTLRMARANNPAKRAADTLAYLRAYRTAYAKLVGQNHQHGSDEHLASLDKTIHQWEMGMPPTSGRGIASL